MLNNVVTALQNIVKAINAAQQTISKNAPSTVATSSSATSGTANLPPHPQGFLTVYVPSLSASVKIPYYNI